MQNMMKFYSKDSNRAAIHAMPGHFATTSTHFNYYIDLNTLKTRKNEAEEVARVLRMKINMLPFVDTIICMDGTEVIGTLLAEQFEQNHFMTNNVHETIYVISPEETSRYEIIFRDNNKGAMHGKHVVILLATVTTGETLRRTLEAVHYYGGIVEGIASVFTMIDELDGYPIHSVFHQEDIPAYQAFHPIECPFCQKGQKIDAMVNRFGYSKID
ncbi:MAG: orotate phosphoribosyltransferase [Lachnospiraceae bacterium]